MRADAEVSPESGGGQVLLGHADALGGGGHALVGRAHHPRHRRAGQEQHGGEQEEDEQDVGPHVREQVARHPEEGLAGDPAVMTQVLGVEEAVADGVPGAEPERAGGQAERERGDQAERAQSPRVDRGEHRPQHHHGAGREQRHRREVARAAEEHEDAVGHRLAHLAPGPAEVEDAGEERRERHQREADQVHLALVECGQPEPGRHAPFRPAAGTSFRAAFGHSSPFDGGTALPPYHWPHVR